MPTTSLSAQPTPTTSPRGRSADAIVIGSGLAGLTTAASLAAVGRKVIVLEQYTVVGGSTHVFRRQGKWEWEVGVHHLADCGLGGDMPTVLRGLGIGEDQIRFRRMKDDGFERLMFPDLNFDTPTDWELYTQRLVDLFPEDEGKIRRFHHVVRIIGSKIDRGGSTASLAGLAKTGAKLGIYAPLANLPLNRVFELFGINPKMQALVSVSPCGSLNCPPARLPFALFCTYYDRFITGGSWFPEGGGQMLSAVLLQSLEQSGGEVITGESVDEILVEGGHTRGVRTENGRTYRAPIVVSTADLKKTYNDLLPAEAVPKRDLRRVQKYRMSDAFFNAFLGVDVDLAAHHPNRDHFSMPTWKTMDDIIATAQLRHGEPVPDYLDRIRGIVPAYVHASNLKDPGNTHYSPAGSTSLEVMLPIGCDYRIWDTSAMKSRDHGYSKSTRYQEAKDGLTEVMIDRATTVFPEIEGHVVHKEAATPITQERYTKSTEGASYGIEMNTSQFGPMRPGPQTSLPGLFLAGASCRPGPTTEGVMLSGVQTADRILNSDLLKDFRRGRPLVPAGELPVNDLNEWDPLTYSRGRSIARSARRGPGLA